MKKVMKDIMTHLPHTIGVDISIDLAEEQMKKYQIRHLPVLEGGNVVGILSDRDLKLGKKFGRDIVVKEIMTLDPFIVSPDANLSEVFQQMAEHRYGAVLVAERNRVVGIFTAIDGLKLLSEVYK